MPSKLGRPVECRTDLLDLQEEAFHQFECALTCDAPGFDVCVVELPPDLIHSRATTVAPSDHVVSDELDRPVELQGLVIGSGSIPRERTRGSPPSLRALSFASHHPLSRAASRAASAKPLAVANDGLATSDLRLPLVALRQIFFWIADSSTWASNSARLASALAIRGVQSFGQEDIPVVSLNDEPLLPHIGEHGAVAVDQRPHVVRQRRLDLCGHTPLLPEGADLFEDLSSLLIIDRAWRNLRW